LDEQLLQRFDHTAALISQLRTIRKNQNIAFKEPLQLLETAVDEISLRSIVQKLVNVSTWEQTNTAPEKALSFRVNTHEYFVPVAASNIAEERSKMEAELAYQQGFLKSVTKKLSNDRFVSNAPEHVVALERQKAVDAEEKITALKSRLASL
jgi:valyl-tRNA synthetase